MMESSIYTEMSDNVEFVDLMSTSVSSEVLPSGMVVVHYDDLMTSEALHVSNTVTICTKPPIHQQTDTQGGQVLTHNDPLPVQDTSRAGSDIHKIVYLADLEPGENIQEVPSNSGTLPDQVMEEGNTVCETSLRTVEDISHMDGGVNCDVDPVPETSYDIKLTVLGSATILPQTSSESPKLEYRAEIIKQENLGKETLSAYVAWPQVADTDCEAELTMKQDNEISVKHKEGVDSSYEVDSEEHEAGLHSSMLPASDHHAVSVSKNNDDSTPVAQISNANVEGLSSKIQLVKYTKSKSASGVINEIKQIAVEVPKTIIPSATKRPRGRPKKYTGLTNSEASEQVNSRTSATVEPSLIERSRLKIVKNLLTSGDNDEIIAESSTEMNQSITKRSRGRPKKHQSPTVSGNDFESPAEPVMTGSHSPTKRQRGRPRNHKGSIVSGGDVETIDTTAETVVTENPSPTTRLRGRPKEVKSPAVSSRDVETVEVDAKPVTADSASPTKRPRGRPKKYKSPTVSIDDVKAIDTSVEPGLTDNSSSAKRLPGRPKRFKSSAVYGGDVETLETAEQVFADNPSSTKRPRGRQKINKVPVTSNEGRRPRRRQKYDNDDKPPFQCTECEHKPFTTRGCFILHVASHKRDQVRMNQNGRYPCTVCPKSYKSKDNALKHIKTHSDSTDEATDGDSKVIKEWNFLCNLCSKRFTQKINLQQHLIVHKMRRVMQDLKRDLGLEVDESNFMNTHQVSRVSCLVCMNTFQKPLPWLYHAQTHLSGNLTVGVREKILHLMDKYSDLMNAPPHAIYICDICGKVDFYLSTHNSHMTNHATKEAFTHCCNHCEKRFPSKSKLTVHRRKVHKRFKCSLCDLRCGAREDIIRHQAQAHSGSGQVHDKTLSKGPNKCTLCDFVGKYRYQLHNHLHNQHNMDFGSQLKDPVKLVCEICKKVFTHRNNLKVHMNTHTKARPHKCPVCDSAFSDRANLLHHGARKHPDQPKQVFLKPKLLPNVI